MNIITLRHILLGCPGGASGKELAYIKDVGSIPGSGRVQAF